ncbi:DUF4296 domain-containing protein [Kaistella polysaccharea]|uniref:DUF4296 domain-containing protein n=1 Tax=Kaistella polysaccharea TaxID=2878534 RepID=UPI0021D42D1F|nr:DUF4296 domain-containing protein [Kaistella polysaccharea]
MKKLFYIFFALLLFSCEKLIDPPKNLVPKETMSALIADFAMNEQLMSVVENLNLDNATRYSLKQNKTTGTAFSESFKYYTATGEIEGVLLDAQNMILDKDPAAKKYIEKKLKENKNVPVFAR